MNGVSEIATSPFHRWLYRWGVWPCRGAISMDASFAWISRQGWKATGSGVFQFLACCHVVLMAAFAFLWAYTLRGRSCCGDSTWGVA